MEPLLNTNMRTVLYTKLSPSWSSYSSMMRPSQMNTSTQDGWRNSSLLRPFIYCHGFAIACYFMVVSLIPTLRRPSSPSAISRFVIPIIIYPVYLMFVCWSFSHVVKETFETVRPPFADYYASATVIGKSYVVRICTPRFHCSPDIVSRCSSFAMHHVSSRCVFAIPASTTFRIPSLESVTCSTNIFPAIALACPKYLQPICINNSFVFYCNKPAETLSSDVVEFAHGVYYNASVVSNQVETIA